MALGLNVAVLARSSPPVGLCHDDKKNGLVARRRRTFEVTIHIAWKQQLTFRLRELSWRQSLEGPSSCHIFFFFCLFGRETFGSGRVTGCACYDLDGKTCLGLGRGELGIPTSIS